MSDDKVASVSTRVYPTQWFSLPALALETPALRAITVPALGAKIVSLFDRALGREWLLPPKNGQLRPVIYGADFVEQDMSGWDEMFPTINPCMYPADGAHTDAALPDHGEVWALAWQHDASVADAIRLRVSGRVLPYTLSRTIHSVDERTLRLSYEVVNTGFEPLSALWTAHPQFGADDATRIVLPAEVTQVVSVQPTAEFPVMEQRCGWRVTTTPAGEPLSLDRVRPASARSHRKVYLPPEQPVRWAGLQQGEDGAWLRLSWDPSQIPYLGIWVDEGSYNPAPTVALEPSTGYYDSLTRAWRNNRVMRLPPGAPQRWWLDVAVGSEGEFPT